ncbi:MmcQ/YjbR family DNA-binding protein [Occallatibacter savannae]|uniref:MmcQ/YjbR family DNA-binding protein n=1 Tax=Occallatibacter savannae TaxID=1002691 RepID=UPI001EF72656|nr:MmcQ/YjbR family DNA-binding protein [Occallatibacter savannae]
MGLPHVAETLNWGHYLVYWAADREIGGKMFAMTDLDGTGAGVLMFHCGAERYHELLESDGVVPAPHLARAHWVMLERWDALRPREIEAELRRAHALTLEKLPQRTRTLLELVETERKRVIRDHRAARAGTGEKPAKSGAAAGRKKTATVKK